ncbi:anti-silence-domain-containing protein [Auricularia subglabra TFB-10046 SS5]|uniref:Anti-silencing function protein 1 n=1 Tax=Auricularia subglabra (strain TFB-10046 / SS5) TaxID=717982 RepID=J0LKL5_AURST|nr:anti-silence-domain-containing protein [Auricularia subglabra TFB-10046 SS5]
MITIRSVEFLNNPARFLDPYRFKVTFECVNPLKDDLEWKLIFVSSPGRTELDQELDDCLVGPVPMGINSFEFQGAPPDKSVIPPEDVLGVAALILTGSYRDQEFVRIGYYQNTEYDNPEMRETPPPSPVFDRLVRDLNDKPRVTRFHVKWDSGAAPIPAAAAAAAPAPVPAPVMQNGATNVAATSAAVPSADAL